MKKIIAFISIALAGLALLGAGDSQFPAQRFGKVTAERVETGGLMLTPGAAAGRVNDQRRLGECRLERARVEH